MAPRKPRKSVPVEYTMDKEDMIMYDIEEEVESTKSIIKRLSGAVSSESDDLLAAFLAGRWRSQVTGPLDKIDHHHPKAVTGLCIYPLQVYQCSDHGQRNPRPDAVALYSGSTPGKRRAWYLPDDRQTASLVGLRGGWRHARMKSSSRLWIQICCARVKALFYPTLVSTTLLHMCATVERSSTDCSLEPKCINCERPHSTDSKLCPKWKTEKKIQEIKTNRNITYIEARKLIAPPTSQTYSQAAKSSTISASTQTDESITKIRYPPLKLPEQPSSLL
ncbi:uncharacterized protein TNCV_3693221 [Trichonephila clavipes]|nr:uncharacterized protein TNCV_3693221 [Trichonephila clavipes]